MDTLPKMEQSVELFPKPPYDFALALRYLATSPSAVLEDVSEEGVYRRALSIDNINALVTVHSKGTVSAPHLLVSVGADTESGNSAPPAVMNEVVARVRAIFSVDDDSERFELSCSRDPVFAELIRRYTGLRPVLIAEPYEALLWAIIGQQVNVTFARKLKLALTERCGRSLILNGRKYLMLPRPQDVASLGEETLRGMQFSRQKTAYILEASRAVIEGEIDFEAMRAMPYDEAVGRLTRFHGIGRWTAEYVLMRGLGARDSIPAADLGLRAIIGRYYGLERTASESEVREIAANWEGYRGWASFYWWFQLQHDMGMRRI